MDDKISLTLSREEIDNKISVSVDKIYCFNTTNVGDTELYFIDKNDPIYVKESVDEIHKISNEIRLNSRKIKLYTSKKVLQVLQCSPLNKEIISEFIGGKIESKYVDYDLVVKKNDDTFFIQFGDYVIKEHNNIITICNEKTFNKWYKEIVE